MLVGLDHYWSLVTGKVHVVKGLRGPTAFKIRLRWVLSGPTDERETVVNFISTHPTHLLRVDAFNEQENLELRLRKFWELESLGVHKYEQSVYEEFTQRISFRQGRYKVHLPWKESHQHLPNNYKLCRSQLNELVRRLRQNPQQLCHPGPASGRCGGGCCEPIVL